MPAPRSNRLRRASGWLATTALLALVPKCLRCLPAYVGAGIALGVARLEVCGVSARGTDTRATSLVLTAVGLGAAAVFVETRQHRGKAKRSSS